MTETPDILNMTEACAFLRADPKTVRNLMRRGTIPFRKFGRTFRFSRAALLKWMEGAK